MNLVLVLDGRAKSRQAMTRLVRDAGHQPIAVADGAVAAELVREHGSELRLIAASVAESGIHGLQRELCELPARPRPLLVLYDPDAPSDAVEPLLGLDGLRTRTRGAEELERELANTTRALQSAEAEREQLMVRLVGAEEAERERIAADIHDDSLQAMASAVLRLGMLARHLPETRHQEAVNQVTLSIEAAIGRLRRLVFELNPPSLTATSLGDALQGYMLEYTRETPVGWTLSDRLVHQPSDELKQILFRVAQESLRNVRKHAAARRIEILLTTVNDGVLLQIKDDGVGFIVEDARRARAGHIGMSSMRERLQRAGGWFEVRSAPGAGAIVEAWLPASTRGRRIAGPIDEPRSLPRRAKYGGGIVR